MLARVLQSKGHTQTVHLTPSQPEFKVMGTAGPAAVVRTYFKLGVEHILLGFDHLLFVLALLFLVGGWRRLVATITAFTIRPKINAGGTQAHGKKTLDYWKALIKNLYRTRNVHMMNVSKCFK